MISVLGISAFYHDSAAALLVDGEIVAAAQEERFTRQKYDERFPTNAIAYCLKEAGLRPEQLDYVGFYDKPFLKFERLLETYLAFAPKGFASFCKAAPIWLNTKLHLERDLNKGLQNAYRKRFIFTEHHESHAASAFYPSPFEEAAILTMDGVGEWATATFGHGRGNRIALTSQQRFPHSLGLLYSAFTYYCGFSVNSGEYKLMGLAPYGTPRYTDIILKHLIDLKEDGSFRMDMTYFNYCHGLTMTSDKFHRLFGGPPRKPDTLLTERDMDIAASIQKVTEEIMIRTTRHVSASTGMKNLCMAGGVALNCVANGRILREGPFENIWVQPASGDAGGALGVAQFIWYQLLDHPRDVTRRDSQKGSLLGPAYLPREIRRTLKENGAIYERIDDGEALVNRVSEEIAQGRVVGWFQGRMEYGPRALGSRSILGDPRNPDMQSIMNVKVKFREGFRPFAPAVLEEEASRWFKVPDNVDSPYMLVVSPVHQDHRRPVPETDTLTSGIDKLKIHRSDIPAVTHVDYSARIQTVDRDRHGLYRALLESFYRKTGCPVFVNTSFNLGWEPIVCTPKDAYTTFMRSEIDVLCMGPFVLTKRKQLTSASLEGRSGDEMLSCPCGSGSELKRDADTYFAPKCGHRFPTSDGIPLLNWPHDESVAANGAGEGQGSVCDAVPFPHYDAHDSVRSLLETARKHRYARVLDESIPYNSTVLEVGCGAGQLSNVLGISCRHVFGTDLCSKSLRLADQFRSSHHLERVRFIQASGLHLPFRPGQFDVILWNGLLHHTSDPSMSLVALLPFLRPGGHIVIGLHNTYARLMTDAGRQILRMIRGAAKWTHPYPQPGKLQPQQQQSRHANHYSPPQHWNHTIGEVLEWLREEGIQFINAVPCMSQDEAPLPNLFAPVQRGRSWWAQFRTQAKQAVMRGRRGGFLIVVGRRPEGLELPDEHQSRTADCVRASAGEN
jgi:carbamoyltransferase